MKAPPKMQPQPWIKLRIKELPGKTLRGLGEAMGNLDAARVTEIMAGTRRVQRAEAEEMAAYLELPYDVVHSRLYGSVPPLGGDVRSPRPAQWTNQQDELRVLGVRDLGGGIVELTDDPAGKERRDDLVPSGPGSFTCYVATDHMSPAYERGDLLMIDPIPPAAPGNDVLLISGGNGLPRKAALRKLVSITDSHWLVKQWHPEKSEKLDRETWHTAYRIDTVRRR